jgi:putative transposase
MTSDVVFPQVGDQGTKPMSAERYKLGINDRVTIDGAHYRPSGRQGRTNLLRLVIDNAVVDTAVKALTDEEYAHLRKARKIRVDEGHYSLAFQLLRDRAVGTNLSDLSDLDDGELRDIAWKVEWCVRFRHAHTGQAGYVTRHKKTPDDLRAFIEAEREAIHAWYFDTFGAYRPPGRRMRGQRPKPYDYPGATTLREWVNLLDAGGDQPGVFRPQYDKCGRREQLDVRARDIVEREVRKFATGNRIKPVDVFERVRAELMVLNRSLSAECQVSVDESAVRRRIKKLPPILIDLAHLGQKRTELKYAPVGKGLISVDGLTPLDRMDRIEMDDWEMDLFVVLKHKHVLSGLDGKARLAARKLKKNRTKVRCTVTVAIDVVTKCVVGLHVTPFSPSAAGSKSALQGIVVDKDPIAKLAGCRSDWPMTARPLEVSTDGGPAFRGDFHDALGMLRVEHRFPGTDPRSRGTIESFFRNLKRLCRIYTGQSFANVVLKGDYPAEDMASLLAENVYLRLVRFIVDDYHHRPHSGLGGMRPYEAWRRAKNDLDPPPDHLNRLLAFGLAVPNRVVAADGVTYMHARYRHPLMGKLRAFLGDRRTSIVTDPNDMGIVLVRVPNDIRTHFPDDGAYLVFEAEGLENIPLSQWLRGNRALRRFEKQERLAGNPFRLTAISDLMEDAEKARRAAGVPSHVISEESLNALVKLIERKGHEVVSERPAPSGTPVNGDVGSGQIGTSVAKPTGGRRRPGTVSQVPSELGGSINLYGEDEE